MKAKKIMALLLFGLLFSGVKAQTMYARPNVGMQSSYLIANIKKLTFEDGNLLVNNITAGNDAFSLFGNRYLNFTDLTLATDTHELVNNIFYVYPNPVTKVLNINSKDPSQTISHLEIISLEGRILIEQNTPEVTVETLPQGLYFCRFTTNNEIQTIKFLKR